MPKVSYNLQLKGFVGGSDFDRGHVDKVLAENEGKRVNVLIDSLGGSLATGLSISSAFKNHGDVAVHFVGLNASAATIASLGAAHISIDAGAMYLVHKCSVGFFEWGSLNSDQFASLIEDITKVKDDLDKMDLNVAQLYARKCKKETTALLDLMKAGGWLTAKEALDWGFVDEITEDNEEQPRLTDALASAMASEGMPIPNLPMADTDREGAFAKFLSAISSLFHPTKSLNNQTTKQPMQKTFTFICALLGIEAIALQEGKASLSEEQLSAIEGALAEKEAKVQEQAATIASLQAKLDSKPAAQTIAVVDENKKSTDTPQNEVEDFVNTYNSAKALFNEV